MRLGVLTRTELLDRQERPPRASAGQQEQLRPPATAYPPNFIKMEFDLDKLCF